MYLVYGIDHYGKQSKLLQYETIEDALQKLRDLAEADEIDSNGPMFRSYGLALDPMPHGPSTEGLYDDDDAEDLGDDFDGPRLRLRRE
ncbi:MAG: hypothetical protein ACR2GY_11260 [Phycisphaerales bacterium]